MTNISCKEVDCFLLQLLPPCANIVATNKSFLKISYGCLVLPSSLHLELPSSLLTYSDKMQLMYN